MNSTPSTIPSPPLPSAAHCSVPWLLGILTTVPGAVSLTAQRADPPALPAPACNLSRSAGLQMLDGQLYGGGHSYKVRFDQDSVEFTAALGRAAPRNYPMRLQIMSIGRDIEQPVVASHGPRFRDLTVEYDRGIAIERYDIGVDALKQSFVFATRPEGQGDLVVRMRLDTDLVVTAEGEGLRFQLPGVGGYRMDAVVGIDGNGGRVAGHAHYANGILELSLPAAFVDSAPLPITLDPPFGGGQFISGAGGDDDETPSAAYDDTHDVFFVVWRTTFSNLDIDIHGHRVSRTALPVGSRVFIETSSVQEIEPDVTNCPMRDAFVVVYNRNGDLLARSVAAANASVSPSILVAGGTSNQHHPTLSAEVNNPHVICVWMSDADIAFQSRRINLAANLGMTLGTVHTFATNSNPRAINPRTCKSDRGSGRHAVVFQREFNNGADSNPHMLLLDSNGALLYSGISLDTSTFDDELPRVDGDGTNWMVAWQRTGGVNDHNILARSISFDYVTETLRFNTGTVAIENEFNDDEGSPSVIFMGDSSLISWMDQAAPNSFRWETMVRSVDPFLCSTCEGRFAIGPLSGASGPALGCVASSGGGTREDVLMVYQFWNPPNFSDDIIVQMWRTVDGLATSLGGQCGEGGTNRASCAASPNQAFALRLRDSRPNAPAALILSGTQAPFACNPCRLIPATNGGIVVPVETNAFGDAAIGIPIAANSSWVGVPLFTQWVVADPATPACQLLGLEMSNALRVVIE